MAHPDQSAIFDEIAETQRRMAQQAQSMHDTVLASDKIVSESRELIARVEQQLQRSRGCWR